MSTGRKSQVEKFNRKWGKEHLEAQVLKEAEIKRAQEDIMTKGEKVMSKMTNNTQEVFAVIARDGMETFMKTWNNSMENVIRETIRNEVKALVQEEIEAAVKGVFAGINDAMKDMFVQQMVKSVMPEANNSSSVPGADTDGDMRKEVVPTEEPKERTDFSKTKSLGWKNMNEAQAHVVLMELMKEAEELHGIDITSSREFKGLGGKFSTAYQKGIPAIFGKGERGKTLGRWEELVKGYKGVVR